MTHLFKPVGTDEALAVADTAGGVLATAIPTGTGASHARIQVQTADVRVTFDGSAPTTTNGFQLPALTSEIWPIAQLSAAKFIRETSTSAVVHIQPLAHA